MSKIEVAHSERAHSKIGASSAKRWFNCPGSVALCETIPTPPSSAAAEEGTAAHELAETCLRGQEAVIAGKQDNQPTASWYVGKKFNGVKVDKEMAEHIQGYVDHIRNLVNSTKGKLYIEKRFHLSHIHGDIFGTCDAVIVAPNGTVHVVDLKYGAGIEVEAVENEQLLIYALGATAGMEFKRCHITIYQPRIDPESPYKEWECDAIYLKNFGKRLRRHALETEREDAPFKAGEWCRFCTAAGVCPELHRNATALAQADFAEPDPKLPQVTALTPAQLGRVVQHKKLLTHWLEAAEELALQQMEAGDKIPGLKLVRKRGSREWKDENAAEKLLTRELGEDAFTRKLLSVAQAEKHLGKTRLANRWQAIEGGITVAPDSDPRPEVTRAEDDFAPEQISVDDF
jgi:hypothetical protein